LCRAACRVLCDADAVAAAWTNGRRLRAALLRETGILCVYGSGFGMPPEAGSFRIVYLADPAQLQSIYADIAAFTQRYLQQA
jgi:aspartate/methionine/tyrosine aminotransferase